MQSNKTILSIVILNYNTKKVTLDAVASIEKNYKKEVEDGEYQVILADNDSPDGSLSVFKDYKKKTKIRYFDVVPTGGNIGFAAGNNKAIPFIKGEYVLFLNPDTVVYPKTLSYMVEFMRLHPDAGAASCKLELPKGGIDEASHRGFPTAWNSFAHFSHLQYLFPKNRLFAGYTQGWKDFSKTHTVDAISGAFLLIPRSLGEKLHWWDEDYFFYGEDLDFCYRIRKAGYNIYYVPEVSILHYGGVSSGIKKQSQNITTANKEIKKKVQGWRFDAMRIFYKKHYSKKYPKMLTWLVMKGIDFLYKRNLPK